MSPIFLRLMAIFHDSGPRQSNNYKNNKSNTNNAKNNQKQEQEDLKNAQLTSWE